MTGLQIRAEKILKSRLVNYNANARWLLYSRGWRRLCTIFTDRLTTTNL